jgi:Rieske Fe-S protein
MNDRRRFLHMLGASVSAFGFGCDGSATDPTTSGSTGNGASSSSTGGQGGAQNCGYGGASNQGVNSDICQSNRGRFAVGTPDNYATAGFHKSTNLDSNVLIVRDAGGLYALSSLCTHQCCDMNTQIQGQNVGTITTSGGKPIIVCNCHISRFRADGTVLSGPASSPLPAYPLSLGCDGVLYVDTTTTVSNTQRLSV